jgi:hypothetical protein
MRWAVSTPVSMTTMVLPAPVCPALWASSALTQLTLWLSV